MILVIDNFDSFTYNLVQYIQMLGHQVQVFRNNKISIAQIEKLKPSQIVISPGPGRPEDAGVSIDVVQQFAGKIPILGVCLGHQAIVQALGGRIIQAQKIVHGKTDSISHNSIGVFYNIAQGIEVTRYHSLAADKNTLPDQLEISAYSLDDGEIMGVKHKHFQLEGVQFHPESIGTQTGLKLLQNFFNYRSKPSNKMIYLGKLSQAQNLEYQEAYEIMDDITEGELTDGQLGSFLGSLSAKSVSADELSAFAQVLRDKTGVEQKIANTLDTCGTGGDGKHTFNISTAAALVCSAMGIKVAKHGNRAISSKSGSFNFLEALQIQTKGDLKQNLSDIEQKNFAFFFAPLFHSAMRHVAKVRQELKIKTVFNMIGPLVNPLQVDHQIVGVFSRDIMQLYIETMKKLGLKRAMVVHSRDGMDELSICDDSDIYELSDGGTISNYQFQLSELELPEKFTLADIKGSSAEENKQLFLQIIEGDISTKQQRAALEAISLNAGAAVYIMGEADSIKQGYLKAKKFISSKKLSEHFQKLKA